jgi:hypothetical protein
MPSQMLETSDLNPGGRVSAFALPLELSRKASARLAVIAGSNENRRVRLRVQCQGASG